MSELKPATMTKLWEEVFRGNHKIEDRHKNSSKGTVKAVCSLGEHVLPLRETEMQWRVQGGMY